MAASIDSESPLQPNITFTGANLHLVSGSGATNDNGNPTGLGNLIIGYDENPGNLGATDRGGSHNLAIGSFNKFTSAAFGGLVAGEMNTISYEGASVSGGLDNVASGLEASVSGGTNNTASGEQASVSGASKTSLAATLPASPAACSIAQMGLRRWLLGVSLLPITTLTAPGAPLNFP